MALDQFAYKVNKGYIGVPVNFDFSVWEGDICVQKIPIIEYDEIYYWSEHPLLEEFMQNLYIKKGGQGVFNCKNLLLNKEDLLALRKLIYTINKAERKEDLKFIRESLKLIKYGYDIVYKSWW